MESSWNGQVLGEGTEKLTGIASQVLAKLTECVPVVGHYTGVINKLSHLA